MSRLERKQLNMLQLDKREHKLCIDDIAITPECGCPGLPDSDALRIQRTAKQIVRARKENLPVVLTYGAHLIKNGLAPVVIRLMQEGWVTHVATNGAGSIHDWEFAFIGKSSEDVQTNTAMGQFGTWEETGRFINLSIAVGGLHGLGYGWSVGKMIAECGLDIPCADNIRRQIAESASEAAPGERIGALSDMLYVLTSFNLPGGWMKVEHSHPQYSVQCAAFKLGVPFTVHPGVGYDIIYTHPMNCGGAIGRGAVRDFLSYADSISQMGGGGVHLAVGSAIMAPMVFEKSMSMANNLSIQKTGKPLSNHHLVVVDIQDGGDWDWSKGEPPMDNPAYYLRFCKSFYRMGGSLDYICLDNRAFMLGLYKAIHEASGCS